MAELSDMCVYGVFLSSFLSFSMLAWESSLLYVV